MSTQPILIDGAWRPSSGTKTFRAVNPATRAPLTDSYPVSPWPEIEQAILAAHSAATTMRGWPGERFARFLERYASLIEGRAAELIELAHLETALPVEPRLSKAELPRTVNQLRQAAAAAREGSWSTPTIDTAANIRAIFAPIGPVCVFGPNNFPFAFNSIAGGDFAAAVAAGNPVIAKGHSSHPGTTKIFAEAALQAARETEMPAGFVQLIYRTEHADGAKLVSHPLVGATGYTGAREAGLTLKQAADRVGKPIYLELSSINPVFILPGAIAERGQALADELAGSCLMGAGQFCTSPGLIGVVAGLETESFIETLANKYPTLPVGTLLGEGVLKHLEGSVATITGAGAEILAGGATGSGKGYSFSNTLLRVGADKFLRNAALQTEAFGNSTLFVVAETVDQLIDLADALEGNLTGSIYSSTVGADDSIYARLEPALRGKVGRLLNDKMPTGVAVSPAMNHGGPFPATGHPGFTAVGIPASIHRFAMLQCYDNVRANRLPPLLQDKSPSAATWRSINGKWIQGDAV